MTALRRLVGKARGLLRRLARTVRAAAACAVAKAASTVRRAASTAETTVRQARERHSERWGSDDSYRTILIAALGALLVTVVPPAVAAAVTSVIGLAGLFEKTRKARASDYQPRYGSPRERYGQDREDRTYGTTLWDQFGDDED